jgi:hypothetical protein
VRAEDSCHAFPKLPAMDACDARRQVRSAERGTLGPRRLRVSRRAACGEGKEPAPGGAYGPAPRQAMTFMVTRSLCGRAHPFSTCSRRLTVTPVVSWLEPAGQGKRSLSCPYFRKVINSRMSRMRVTALQPGYPWAVRQPRPVTRFYRVSPARVGS